MRVKSNPAKVLQAAKWVAIWSTPLIALTAAALAASYRVYPGAALPRPQVAVLTLSHVEAITVDEHSTLVCEDADPQRTARMDAVMRSFLRWPPAPSRDAAISAPQTTGSLDKRDHKRGDANSCAYETSSIELLPGAHTITFACREQPNTGFISLPPITQAIFVEAGKTYTARRAYRITGQRKQDRYGKTYDLEWWVDFIGPGGKTRLQ